MTVTVSKRVPTRRLGNVEVGAIGIGCTAMSGWYGQASEDEAIAVFRKAHDYGVTLIDTADCYGPYTSEETLGRGIKGIRDKVVLSTKGGLVFTDRANFQLKPDARPEYLKTALEASLKRLQTDYIDLYYLHRPDPNVAIEETVGCLADMVRAGKIRAIGLSEVMLPTLKRAHAVHPIASLESELSLWTRGPLDEILPWCAQNGVGFVPYAPLGRGFLAGNVKPGTKFAAGDFRANNPRFTDEAIRQNAVYLERIRAIANRHDSSPAVVALAWLLARSPNVVPIPGMEKLQFLDENVKATWLELSPQDLAELDALPPAFGDRYPARHQSGST
jgi:aryl-alcohol dehydrogenase-like predicted oxidoreductase